MLDAHRCAMALAENAYFIQRELHNVKMSDDLRERTSRICGAMIATKFDLVTEVSEMNDLLDAGSTSDVVLSQLRRALQWVQEDIAALNELVAQLRTASEHDPGCRTAYVLVVESATNVIEAFLRIDEATGPPANGT